MTRHRRARGYLLMEAALGGAIMVTIFGVCLTLIATGRSQTSIAARRQVAADMVSAKLTELQTRPTLTAVSVPLAPVDVVNHPGLRLGFDVVDVTTAMSASGPVGGRVFEIVVVGEHGPGDASGAPAVITLRSLRRLR